MLDRCIVQKCMQPPLTPCTTCKTSLKAWVLSSCWCKAARIEQCSGSEAMSYKKATVSGWETLQQRLQPAFDGASQKGICCMWVWAITVGVGVRGVKGSLMESCLRSKVGGNTCTAMHASILTAQVCRRYDAFWECKVHVHFHASPIWKTWKVTFLLQQASKASCAWPHGSFCIAKKKVGGKEVEYWSSNCI